MAKYSYELKLKIVNEYLSGNCSYGYLQKKYRIRFTKKAEKQLKKLDKSQSLIIMGWISKNLENTENPRQIGKSLSGNFSGAWRYHIGDYRLIADIDDNEIKILDFKVGHRKDIYK